jgi:hypothetical protein
MVPVETGPTSSAGTCIPTIPCSIRLCARSRRVFVVRVPDGPAAPLACLSINYALAVTTESLPAPPESTRLPELLLTEVLRIHLETAPMA